jgi:hypothetical protein
MKILNKKLKNKMTQYNRLYCEHDPKNISFNTVPYRFPLYFCLNKLKKNQPIKVSFLTNGPFL